MAGIGRGEMFWKLHVSMTFLSFFLYCEITGFNAGETSEEVAAKWGISLVFYLACLRGKY